MSVLLTQRGFGVTALGSLDDTYTLLMRAAGSTSRFDAVVIGWPEYSDGIAEDVFGLLHGALFEHLPVLVLSDSTSAAAINWRMTRPRTSLLPWADFQEAPAALSHLLEPNTKDEAPISDDGPPLRMLLVDDSATVRAAFSRLLSKDGFIVETASGVAEGLNKLRSQTFDIAVVDYFMPGRNGTELIAELRHHPQTARVVPAIITGAYSDDVIRASLASGAVECLFKSEAKELFIARINSLARTVRDRKAIESERRRLEGILSSVGDGVYMVDPEGGIRLINPAALDLLGYSDADALLGKNAYEAVHYAHEDGTLIPRGQCPLLQSYARGSELTGWQTAFWTQTGRAVPVECTVFPMRVDGERSGSVIAFRDVSARRRLEADLRWAAEHDTLTKLHNRHWFERQLEEEIARLRRSHQTSLLLFMDVDRFKYINDTAGHGAGDQLLIEVAQRLKLRLRGSDHLARMGGDEFALILRNVSVEDYQNLADGFRRALTAAPFSYGGKSYRITTSIGVAALDNRTLSPSEAMAQADLACHNAKNSGRNQTAVFTPDSGERAAMDRDLGWSVRLEEALRHNLFVLAYQPIVPLEGILSEGSDGGNELWRRQLARNPESPAMFEVLLRMKDSQGELILPAAFMPTAERFGMMRDIDRWVIENALRDLRNVRDSARPVSLTINLHTQSLGDTGLAAYVTNKVVEYDIDASQLIFEITESHAIDDVAGAQRVLHDLRQLALRIAVDDFGTGFSTFAYLRQLEADILKIDGSLIQGLPHDPLDRTVVAALTSIAEAAGKITIAECVEDPEALIALLECGVDLAQGNAVGQPRLHLRAPPLIAVKGEEADEEQETRRAQPVEKHSVGK
ncbi:EAL domain-containing protein [Pseudoxanthomonas sp. CAU 1598]|uniref:EAL domain-containing protein n=1 Tax=Pseudomarimonas arenosa TaxID=2774145 RepID=A0AAW3ZN00_9GAMM|nr:GGDEF domain-containing response regulator [Pseudomarimonas arenosa]MBD8526300.1 EAL domain-containing protein [Pseudomarimonas arenosa]